LAYWEKALHSIGDLITIVIEADDLAGQNSLLMSPETYREIIKPFQMKLFSSIKKFAPVKIFFHSCGAIRPLIRDLIDTGIDILNPVQISATGMNLKELKHEFGKNLVFWGGGVDTQRVLEIGKPKEIKNDVKKNIEALAPGGGFIFAAVHNIQPNVPPENIISMWEAWLEFGAY
jgi:uroporphyrinogen decarboxylase